MMQQVCILGVTGSIGLSTLKVLARHPQRYQLFAVSAQQRIAELVDICSEFNPKRVAIPASKVDTFCHLMQKRHLTLPDIVTDVEGLVAIAEDETVDIVMAAIVGSAGLLPTLAATRAGKRVLLANKEALVMSGDLLLKSAAQSQAIILPVDSEHNAIFQCLPETYHQTISDGQPHHGVAKVLLTASGGPFLHTESEQLVHVTPAQACQHPNWSMGQKISVDSATLMNKGLELIEACYLFGLHEQFIEVVIHPQSIIHSMVQYVDGSTLAQLGAPDMCTPIAHALAWPERIESTVDHLDIFKVSHLDFFKPDTVRFPALNYARHAVRQGGTAPTILNAANEVAVAAFLDQNISFTQITQVVDATLQQVESTSATTLDAILTSDQSAKQYATRLTKERFAR